jgi:hypothetical protein
MPEPIATIGVGAIAAYLGKDGLEKLLGPTAEYLGNGLREFTKKRVENVCRILQKAQSRLGNKVEQPGTVPPKVLKSVLNDGSFSDDAISVEYFGGILASSRTEQGRDDRGARIAKMVDGMSTYQLRTHYLIYNTIRSIFQRSGLRFNMDGRPKMQIFVPMTSYTQAMDFSAIELAQLWQILTHVLFGLHADSLLEGRWQFGSQDSMKSIYAETTADGGFVSAPSALGGELFLWAFGQADKPLDFILDAAFEPKIEGVTSFFPDAQQTHKT